MVAETDSERTPDEVLNFWFVELSREDWFRQKDEIDQTIILRFQLLHEQAAAGELNEWRSSIHGCLAEIILLDQFPRNMFRGDAKAFSTDNLALVLSQEALKREDVGKLTSTEKPFLVMPYMHSESLQMHEQALQLFSEPGLKNNLDFERSHKLIIDRFGRYPHRNKLLGRKSTPEEIEFLESGGATFG